jgi:hypothetical protein
VETKEIAARSEKYQSLTIRKHDAEEQRPTRMTQAAKPSRQNERIEVVFVYLA